MKAFVERQKLSAEAETAIHNNHEDDRANEFLKRTLDTGHRYYVTLLQCMWHRQPYMPLYRYKITADVGEGHKLLGKVMKYSVLTTTELDKLPSNVPDVDVSKCIVYGRVLLSGVVYTSSIYHRSEVTNDSMVRLKSTEIGTIQKFMSCCRKDCTSCNENTFANTTSLSQFIPHSHLASLTKLQSPQHSILCT